MHNHAVLEHSCRTSSSGHVAMYQPGIDTLCGEQYMCYTLARERERRCTAHSRAGLWVLTCPYKQTVYIERQTVTRTQHMTITWPAHTCNTSHDLLTHHMIITWPAHTSHDLLTHHMTCSHITWPAHTSHDLLTQHITWPAHTSHDHPYLLCWVISKCTCRLPEDTVWKP